MGKTKRRRGIFKILYAFSMAVLVINMSFLGVFFAVPEAGASPKGSGAIWTTLDDCGDSEQNVNQYSPGDYVYINGGNFGPNNSFAWSISGKPGNASADPNTVVASGEATSEEDGSFCVKAYKVQNDDDGTYNVDADGKKDNYTVDGGNSETDCIDNDGDGYGVGKDCLGGDCNDGNPDKWRTGYFYSDKDGDGYHETNPPADPETGLINFCYGLQEDFMKDTTEGPDCDDMDPDINPAASEVCGDGKDNDCDGDYDCNDSDCADYCTRDCEVGDPVLIQGYADYVDLGNESSEDGHSLSGWTDEWVNPGWGGTYGGGSEDGSFRLLMGPGDGCGKGYEDASLSFDTGDGYYVDTITFEHLDGSVDDSFDVFVNDVQVGHYTGDQEEGEAWVESSYSFPAVTGSVTVDFIATEPDNEWCGDWGQVAFSWVGVTGYSCESGEPECTDESEDWAQLDYVDVGDSASEYDRDLTGWSEENLPGNYGGCQEGDVCTYRQVIEEPCTGEEKEASLTLEAGDNVPAELVVKHLDGISLMDSFEVYVNGQKVGEFIDDPEEQSNNEEWENSTFDLSGYGFSGELEVKFRAIDEIWDRCTTYGQVSVDWIKLMGCGEPYVPEVPGICGYKYDTQENGLEDWTIKLYEINDCQEGDEYADRWVNYDQGSQYDGNPVDSQRSNPDAGLIYESGQDVSNFFSLGFGGWYIAEFDNPIVNNNGTDPDLRITEDTWGGGYPLEKADVSVSQDGIDWIYLGEADNTNLQNIHTTSEFDLGGLDWARYVKIEDTSERNDFAEYPTADGYDLNSIEGLVCDNTLQVVATTTTDSDGHYCFFPEAGDYRVEEVQQEGWSYVDYFYQDVTYSGKEKVNVDFVNEQEEQSDPYCGDGEINQKWEQCDDGNTQGGDGCNERCQIEENPGDTVTGCKYKDLNNNGEIDEGEPTVSGWEISLYGCYYPRSEFGIQAVDIGDYLIRPELLCEQLIATTTTGEDGCYAFERDESFDPDELKIVESGREGWTQTYPVEPAYYQINPEYLTATSSFDFANYHPECGNGILDKGEECDDNNKQNGDGCSSVCEEESSSNGGGSNGGSSGGGTPYCSIPGVDCGQSSRTTETTETGEQEILVLGESGEPMLDIGKTLDKYTANPNDTIEVRLVITNNGDIDAVDVVVNDVWPEGFSSEGERTRSWELGDLAPGQVEVITHTVDVGGDVESGVITSPATAVAVNNPAVEASVDVTVKRVEVLAASGFSLVEFLLLVSGLSVLAGAGLMLKRRTA